MFPLASTRYAPFTESAPCCATGVPLVETGGFSTGFSELLAGVLLDDTLLEVVLLVSVLLTGALPAGVSEVVVLVELLLVSLTAGVPSGEIISLCEVLEYVDELPCGLELPPLAADDEAPPSELVTAAEL